MPLTIMELCYVLQASENWILLPSHLFATELPGSNFLPPTLIFQRVANGIFRKQICYLLLLILNPERDIASLHFQSYIFRNVIIHFMYLL